MFGSVQQILCFFSAAFYKVIKPIYPKRLWNPHLGGSLLRLDRDFWHGLGSASSTSGEPVSGASFSGAGARWQRAYATRLQS